MCRVLNTVLVTVMNIILKLFKFSPEINWESGQYLVPHMLPVHTRQAIDPFASHHRIMDQVLQSYFPKDTYHHTTKEIE